MLTLSGIAGVEMKKDQFMIYQYCTQKLVDPVNHAVVNGVEKNYNLSFSIR